MTIHDLPSETNHEPSTVEPSHIATGDPALQQQPDEFAVRRDQRAGADAASADDYPGRGAEPSTETSLFGGTALEELRREWDSVQAGFVDDPRRCVEQADGLVSSVVKQLISGFDEARSRLEQQWGRGEQASTEDLRVALKRYREFFDRLLAV